MQEEFDWGEELRPLLEKLVIATKRQYPFLNDENRRRAVSILVIDFLQAMNNGAVITITAEGTETRHLSLATAA